MGKKNLAVAGRRRNGSLSCSCWQRFLFWLCTRLPRTRSYPGLHFFFCYFAWPTCVCSNLRNFFKPKQGNGYVGVYLFSLGVCLCCFTDIPDVTCFNRQRIYILDLYGNVYLCICICSKINTRNQRKIIRGDRAFLAATKR